MKIALIITTYNRPDALEAVLSSLANQSVMPFEVLIADDGSNEATRILIEKNLDRYPFKIHHIWQEDRGFRAGAARNRAASRSQSDYFIFIDGDCIAHPHFIQAHRNLAKAHFFLSGNRILLSESFTHQILSQSLPLHHWSYWQWMQARLSGKINRFIPLIRSPFDLARHWAPKRWRGVKTCNLSLFQQDFARVNGFDENYAGWGLEDSDLVIRLIRAGVQHKSARFAAPVFHLWHKDNDRSQLEENKIRLNKLLDGHRIQAELGLDQYL